MNLSSTPNSIAIHVIGSPTSVSIECNIVKIYKIPVVTIRKKLYVLPACFQFRQYFFVVNQLEYFRIHNETLRPVAPHNSLLVVTFHSWLVIRERQPNVAPEKIFLFQRSFSSFFLFFFSFYFFLELIKVVWCNSWNDFEYIRLCPFPFPPSAPTYKVPSHIHLSSTYSIQFQLHTAFYWCWHRP